MEQPILPLPGSTAPAVLLGSGPGPAPALDRPMPARDAIPTLTAILDPVERSSGLRGWMLTVSMPTNVSSSPKHHFSKVGARPPLIAARVAALQALGYELADPDDLWRWHETTTLDDKQVELYACIDVRPLQQHREAAL